MLLESTSCRPLFKYLIPVPQGSLQQTQILLQLLYNAEPAHIELVIYVLIPECGQIAVMMNLLSFGHEPPRRSNNILNRLPGAKVSEYSIFFCRESFFASTRPLKFHMLLFSTSFRFSIVSHGIVVYPAGRTVLIQVSSFSIYFSFTLIPIYHCSMSELVMASSFVTGSSMATVAKFSKC